MVTSDLYPGQRRKAYNVQYMIDKQEQEFEEEELRPLLVVNNAGERNDIIRQLTPAFDYLESRITGTCDTQYSCQRMHRLCELLQVCDRHPTNSTIHATNLAIMFCVCLRFLIQLM